MEDKIIKALRFLSDRIADDRRDSALANGLFSDTCYSVQESRDNAWEYIEKILKGE